MKVRWQAKVSPTITAVRNSFSSKSWENFRQERLMLKFDYLGCWWEWIGSGQEWKEGDKLFCCNSPEAKRIGNRDGDWMDSSCMSEVEIAALLSTPHLPQSPSDSVLYYLISSLSSQRKFCLLPQAKCHLPFCCTLPGTSIHLLKSFVSLASH